MFNRRSLLGAGVATLGAAAAGQQARAASAARDITGDESAKLFLPPGNHEVASFDRLPLEWHKGRFKLLQSKIAELGYDGILLTDAANIVYFTGMWHQSTERLLNVFVPATGNHPIWIFPALDRDLIYSWWFEDGDMYFDWPDVEGAAPYLGKVIKGPTVDIWRWALDRVKKRGFGAKKAVAVDRELTPSKQKVAADVFRRAMPDAGGVCTAMRIRKTPEEMALIQRTYNYSNRIHAFARDLLLTRGTDLTDFEVTLTVQQFAGDLILADIKRDGKPHTAVGIQLEVICRTGQATAYPHNNQFFHKRVERGDAFQVVTTILVGGCGGELYRPYMLAPRTSHMEKLWRVVRDGCLMQKDLQRAGTQCSDVAYAIHKFQVAQGMQDFIYHRPAHGQGAEGHQPPYLALGDHTVLEEGMCFSVEPGLFDPKAGIGANFSDMFTVQREGPARQLSRLPWSEEWAFLKI